MERVKCFLDELSPVQQRRIYQELCRSAGRILGPFDFFDYFLDEEVLFYQDSGCLVDGSSTGDCIIPFYDWFVKNS